MFEKLEKNFTKAQLDISLLETDISKMIIAAETNTKASRTSLEPMTRLRKDTEEVKKANEYPDMQFIEDKINDILKGMFE